MLFSDLTPEQEIIFRQWARDHWKPGRKPESIWHPVIRDEWRRIDAERMTMFVVHLSPQTAARFAAIGEDPADIIADAIMLHLDEIEAARQQSA